MAAAKARPGGSGFLVQRTDPHQAHQTLHPLAVHQQAALLELIDYPAAAQKRLVQVNLIDRPGVSSLSRTGW